MGISTAKAKAPIQVKTKQKQFVYHSFAADYEHKTGKDVVQGTYMLNCDCTGGKLRLMNSMELCKHPKTGSAILLPQSPAPKALYELRRVVGETENVVFCYTVENGDLYVAASTSGTKGKLYNVGKDAKGVLVYDQEKKQALMFVGEEGAFMYSIEAGQWCTKKKLLPLGCFVKGRLFSATEQGKLVYFSPFDSTFYQETMEDAGEVQLPQEAGKIMDVVGVDTYVYIFCEYGIFRLTVAASARDFYLENVPYGSGEIMGNSACATTHNGGEIFFMTSHGLHTLNGKKVVAHGNIANVSMSSKLPICKAMQVDGKYLVQFISVNSETLTFAVDLETKQAYPSDMYDYTTAVPGGALSIMDNFLCRLRMNDGESYENNMVFEAKMYFGSAKMKLLKNVCLLGTGEVQLQVKSEHGHRKCNAGGEQGFKKVDLKGVCFTLRITCGRGQCVSGLIVDVVTLQ